MEYPRLQVLVVCALSLIALVAGQQCPPPGFNSVQNFDLASYISAPWYVQQQMPVVYQPTSDLYCVRAQYVPLDPNNLLAGVLVKNYANENKVNGEPKGTSDDDSFFRVTAIIPDPSQPSKLRVGFGLRNWNLPDNDVFKGDYWIVAAGNGMVCFILCSICCHAYQRKRVQNISAGSPNFPGYDWAIVSGGAPTAKSNGGCRTGSKISLLTKFQTNNIGLWLFSRKPVDPVGTIVMRSVAQSLGFDLSVLANVQQAGCTYKGA